MKQIFVQSNLTYFLELFFFLILILKLLFREKNYQTITFENCKFFNTYLI